MQDITKKYIVDELNNKIAVQIDIDTYEKIEEALENYGLMKGIFENQDEGPMMREEAKTYYASLPKAE